MTSEKNTTDSFMENKDPYRITVKDVLVTVLLKLHWFVLCAAIGGALAWWKCDCTERFFESHARIKIHSVTRNVADDGLSHENVSVRRSTGNWNTLNDEILILESETAMLEVARRLNLGTTYQYRTKVAKRPRDLYGDVPIEVSFLDLDEDDNAKLNVRIVSTSQVELYFGDDVISGSLGETLYTPVGRVIVKPTWAMRDSYIDYNILVNHRNIVDVADYYRKRVDVTKNSSSDWIIDLSLEDGSPMRAADVINEMIAVYNETSINNIRQTSEYINERIAKLETELGSQEAQIAEFKRDNQLLDEDFGQVYVAASIASTEEMERLRGQISHAEYLKSLLDVNGESRLIPMSVNIDDEIIRGTISRYNETVLNLDKYNVSGTSNNPVVHDMLLELSAMKINLAKLLDSYVVALKQKELQAEATVQRTNSMIKDMPEEQLYLDNLTRVESIKEKLFVDLLSKREEMLVSQPSIEGNARIVDRARVNRDPVSPDVKKCTMKGALLGMLVPIVLFLLWRILDTRVRYRKDVENNTEVPVIGVIPSRKRQDKRFLVVSDDDHNAMSESFRILRSRFYAAQKPKTGATALLFLSLQEKSGKSFVAANMALSFAQIGKRVVLIDMNLRKGTLTELLCLDEGDSLSDYLAGNSSNLPSLIHQTEDMPGVDVIPCGELPSNPAELLSSKRLDLLIAWLRERYDYILIDSVPYGVVADGSLTGRLADITLFVLRSGQIDKRQVPALDEIRDSGEFQDISVILNDVKYKRRIRNYGYGYDHGCGSSYRYDSQYGC